MAAANRQPNPGQQPKGTSPKAPAQRQQPQTCHFPDQEQLNIKVGQTQPLPLPLNYA